ncbi:MAG TPA: hypothetical protein VF070_35650 [Streptosporangiaceae bacterium]
MTGAGSKRVSLAALIAVRPRCRPRLIYRTHHGRSSRTGHKGFTETDYARFLDAAHQRLDGLLVMIWDNHLGAAGGGQPDRKPLLAGHGRLFRQPPRDS